MTNDQARVSTSGGQFPAWSAVAHELLFLGIDDRITTASYTTQGNSFSAGTPRVWSPVKIRRIGVQQNFDVAPDGKLQFVEVGPRLDLPQAV